MLFINPSIILEIQVQGYVECNQIKLLISDGYNLLIFYYVLLNMFISYYVFNYCLNFIPFVFITFGQKVFINIFYIFDFIFIICFLN